MANIIVKKYQHYNSSMGKYIKTKRDYFTEMDRGGYVSQEEGERRAKTAREQARKDYKLSDKARQLLYCAEQTKDKKGNIKVSDRMVDGMKDVGVNFNIPSIYKDLPLDKGGF